MIDDIIAVSECGFKSDSMNAFIYVKSAQKNLQIGPDKCKKINVGKRKNKILCGGYFC